MTETAQTLHRPGRRFATILDRAQPHWDAPTPCEGWTVRDVVEHVIDTEREFLERQELAPGPSPDRDDPGSAWRSHAAAVAEVLGRDGVADTEYDGYFGRTTVAATMADFYGWDLVVHGSDVARATGQGWSVGDEEAARLHATADGWGDALTPRVSAGAAVEVATTRRRPIACWPGWVATRLAPLDRAGVADLARDHRHRGAGAHRVLGEEVVVDAGRHVVHHADPGRAQAVGVGVPLRAQDVALCGQHDGRREPGEVRGEQRRCVRFAACRRARADRRGAPADAGTA